MFRSLRAKLIFASFLWTTGLLLLMHILSLLGMRMVPDIMRLRTLHPAMFGVFLMIVGLAAAWRSLMPFRQLRSGLNSARRGGHVSGVYPTEVQPLVDDLNALLDDREKAVKRALATAGDLAHGLKTPLALLAHEAERARNSGNPELADGITQQVDRMSRQVNYHLARARAAASGASGAASCPIAPSAEALIRTLAKLYAGRALQITAQIPPELCARIQREDLDEILGNLLDNACKWGKSRIVLRAAREGSQLRLTVEDDGPGLAPELRGTVLERGVRADEVAPGSGLGLAIVRDLTELYGGSISLDESGLGGLRATVSLPSAV